MKFRCILIDYCLFTHLVQCIKQTKFMILNSNHNHLLISLTYLNSFLFFTKWRRTIYTGFSTDLLQPIKCTAYTQYLSSTRNKYLLFFKNTCKLIRQVYLRQRTSCSSHNISTLLPKGKA